MHTDVHGCEDPPEAVAGGGGPASLPDYDSDAVRAAVMALPAPYREVALLSVYEDLTYAEIAAALGCPLGTVASRKAAAVRLLRTKLAHLIGPHEGDHHDL